MEEEDMAEKTLVHKTAVKQISTHRDQENVKKYVFLRTLLATWSLLKRINTAMLQVSSNLVTEKYIELLKPLNFDWKWKQKPKSSGFLCSNAQRAKETAQCVFALWWTVCPKLSQKKKKKCSRQESRHSQQRHSVVQTPCPLLFLPVAGCGGDSALSGIPESSVLSPENTPGLSALSPPRNTWDSLLPEVSCVGWGLVSEVWSPCKASWSHLEILVLCYRCFIVYFQTAVFPFFSLFFFYFFPPHPPNKILPETIQLTSLAKCFVEALSFPVMVYSH